ncbi:DUF922 domain-containing protein [Hymenobacter rubidus]|uniref:DUF922 domain-containing protein n=1 Tax=Hymenobacter rubidus TaxID=1441626 RepID=UPI00191F88E0|nr:DUF922 domain-containing protein [Hymenobacter rubidus]
MLSFLTSFLVVASLLQGPAAKPGQGPAAKPVPASAVPAPAAAGVAAKPAPAPPIQWSATRKLAVADFLGRPGSGDPLASSTSSDIKANAACKDFVFSSTVLATFDPNKSWFRNPKTASEALLRHEQTHFDITEVYARIMRQKMVLFQAKADCLKLQPAFNNLTKGVYDLWDKEQNRYDQETNHGLNAVRQASWEKQTQAKLEQLQAFALPQ